MDNRTNKNEHSLLHSFKCAFAGIFSAIKRERNMKIHVAAMALVIFAGFALKISKAEWIICVVLFGIVLAAEMLNTVIEIMIDELIPYQNEKAKLAKDIAAGAVLTLAIASAMIGIMIFAPKLS